MSKTFSLKFIADYVNGRLSGNANRQISGAAPIDQADDQQIAFAEKGAALKRLSQTKAAAVIVPFEVELDAINLIKVKNPRLAFAKVLGLFDPTEGKHIILNRWRTGYEIHKGGSGH